MKATGFAVRNRKHIYIAIFVCSLFFAKVAQACTGIRLIAEDGSVVCARTLEFGIDLDSSVIVVPRGYARTGTTPQGENGLRWNSRYASLGANGVGLPFIFDGVNEKGLAVGLFYFPTTAGYVKYNADEASKTIAPWELGSWILENFATVAEVKDHIASVEVADVEFKQWGFVPPVHYVVHDASGKSIVIEYVEGKLHVHDNPLGVMTNSPTFDWHMTNLRNYVNFSMVNKPPIEVGDVQADRAGPGHGDAGYARRLHAAVALCSRRRVQHFGFTFKDRRRSSAPGISHLEQLRHSRRRGARRAEGCAWQHRVRPYHLDERLRLEGEAILFPDLREQSDSFGGPDEDAARRSGDHEHLDERAGGYQVA